MGDIAAGIERYLQGMLGSALENRSDVQGAKLFDLNFRCQGILLNASRGSLITANQRWGNAGSQGFRMSHIFQSALQYPHISKCLIEPILSDLVSKKIFFCEY